MSHQQNLGGGTNPAGEVNSITGTQNQVLANSSFGTPVTGVVTLATPQDIGTTSSPTFAAVFGALGLSTAPTFASSANPLTGLYFPDANTLGFSANGNANFIVTPFIVSANKLFQTFSGTSTNYTVPGGYPYAVTDSADNVVYVDCSSARTINFPNTPTDGRIFTVKDATGQSSTNAITLTTPGGTVTIDNSTSKTLSLNWGSWTFQARGGNYYTIEAFSGFLANGTFVCDNSGTPIWLANSGTPGYVLTANSGSPPSWQALPSSGVTSAIGTDNQVLVNGLTGAGNAQTGAVTFTLPQDIAITSTPTFSRIFAGVGSAASPGFSFTGQTNYGLYYASSQTFLAANGTGWFSVSSGGVSASVGELRSGGILSNNAGRRYRYTDITGAGINNVTTIQHWLSCTNTAARTNRLPQSGMNAGQLFITQDGSFNAATNPITIDVNGGVKTINSFTSLNLKSNGASCISAYDGTNYNILASHRMYSTALGRIVDPNGDGDFTTIAAATAAAVSGDTIFIRNGIYTENFSPKSGVTYVGYNTSENTPGVAIVGKMSFSSAVLTSFRNIFFQTNSDFIVEITGTENVSVEFKNCYFNATNNTAFSCAATAGNQSLKILECDGDLGTTGITWFVFTRGSVVMKNTVLENGATSTLTSSWSNSSSLSFRDCNFMSPITTNDSASAGMTSVTMRLGGGYNLTCLNINGSGATDIEFCTLESGTSPCCTVGAAANLQIYECTLDSTNSNPITGTGGLLFGGLTYTNTARNIQSTLTQTERQGSYYGAQMPLIQRLVASNSASIDFTVNTNLFESYFFVFDNVQPASAGSVLQMQMSNDGGSSWVTTGYQAGCNVYAYNSATGTNTNSTTNWLLSGAIRATDGNDTANGECYVHKCNMASKSWLTGQCSYYDNSSSLSTIAILGGSSGSTGTNAFRFLMSSGNISTGTFTCYGIKKVF